MRKGTVTGIVVVAAGVAAGFIVGLLVTWFPIRLLFCAWYNAPDCEEIVLMAFPLYCFIAPLLGGVATYLLYRRSRNQG